MKGISKAEGKDPGKRVVSDAQQPVKRSMKPSVVSIWLPAENVAKLWIPHNCFREAYRSS